MVKKGLFAAEQSLFIEKIAAIYVQFSDLIPRSVCGVVMVPCCSHPYLQADLKKMRNKDRETGISPFSRLSGTTPTLLLLILEEALTCFWLSSHRYNPPSYYSRLLTFLYI